MRFAGQFWVLDEPAAQSDALIVLGDDNYAGDRAFHAAELYREGVAPVVVASGRMLRRNAGIAEVMQHDLESFGVPTTSIVPLAHRAENTREEAGEVAKLIHAREWKRVMVVTSNYHARRTRFIYGRVLPASVTFRVSGARDSEFDPSRWWQTRQGQKLSCRNWRATLSHGGNCATQTRRPENASAVLVIAIGPWTAFGSRCR